MEILEDEWPSLHCFCIPKVIQHLLFSLIGSIYPLDITSSTDIACEMLQYSLNLLNCTLSVLYALIVSF